MWTPRPSHCAAGDDLLSRGAWTQARDAFAGVLRERESPDALEGLALAAWWLDDADVVFDARERAYRLYTERGDRRSAGRVAVWLAWDAWAFRGEHAVSSGPSPLLFVAAALAVVLVVVALQVVRARSVTVKA